VPAQVLDWLAPVVQEAEEELEAKGGIEPTFTVRTVCVLLALSSSASRWTHEAL
jgi:hypothetical protein